MKKLILMYMLFLCLFSKGQSFAPYYFYRISIANGLNSNSVSQVAQDKRQYIWIGTMSGLQRYDGYGFLNFIHIAGDRNSIPSNNITNLHYEGSSRLWVVCSHQNVGIFDTRRYVFREIPVVEASAHPYYLHIATGKDGSLLLYDTANGGKIFRYSESLQQFLLVSNKADKPGQTVYFSSGTTILNNGSLLAYEKEPNLKITRIATGSYKSFQQRKGRRWLYGDHLLEYKPNRTGGNWQPISQGADGRPLLFGEIRSIYEDHDENLWLSTDNGLYVFHPDADLFTSYFLPLAKNIQTGDISGEKRPAAVISALECNNGNLLLASGQGLYYFDSSFQPLPLPGLLRVLENEKITSVCQQGGSEQVWFGLSGGRVAVYNEKKQTFSNLNLKFLHGATIQCLAADLDSNLWIATGNGDLFQYKKGQAIDNFHLACHIDLIKKVLVDPKGRIWIAAATQVLVYDPEKQRLQKILSEAQVQNNLAFSDLKLYHDTAVLIAAGVLQLVHLKDFSVTTIDEAFDGTPLNDIVSLEVDKKGMIWCSRINGIYRLDLQKRYPSFYDTRNGIYYDKFEQGGSYKLKDGSLLFFTDRNFLLVKANKFQQKQNRALEITGIELNGKMMLVDSVLASGMLNMVQDNTSLLITFTDFSFSKEFRYQHFYRLKGFDKDWICSSTKTAAYSNLPPGQYIFETRTMDIDGVSSAVTSPFIVRVRLPLWKSPWLYFILLAIAAIIVYVFYRTKVSNLVKLEQMRSRISRDLHDDIGSTLSTITILSQIALHDENRNNHDHLSRINTYSSQLMVSMNDIVWSINPANDNLERISARMREYLANTLESQDINYRLELADSIYALSLDMETRRNLYLIFKEGVNNIAKYANCTDVSIFVDYSDGKLLMVIKDNGIGFSTDDVYKKGNGLINMVARAERVGGECKIISEPGKGTSIVVVLPC